MRLYPTRAMGTVTVAAAMGLGAVIVGIPAGAATGSKAPTTVTKAVMLRPSDLPKGWKVAVTKDTGSTPTSGFAGLETCEGVTPSQGAAPPSRLRELQTVEKKSKTRALTVEESITHLAKTQQTQAWGVVGSTKVVSCVEPAFAHSIAATQTLAKAGYTATVPTASPLATGPAGPKTADFTMQVQLKQASGTSVTVSALIFSAVRHGYLVGLTMLGSGTIPGAESGRVEHAALKALSRG